MRPQTRRAALGPLAGISGNRPRTARLRGPAMPKSHAWNPDPRPCSTQAGPCATDAAPADYPKRALNFLYASTFQKGVVQLKVKPAISNPNLNPSKDAILGVTAKKYFTPKSKIQLPKAMNP